MWRLNVKMVNGAWVTTCLVCKRLSFYWFLAPIKRIYVWYLKKSSLPSHVYFIFIQLPHLLLDFGGNYQCWVGIIIGTKLPPVIRAVRWIYYCGCRIFKLPDLIHNFQFFVGFLSWKPHGFWIFSNNQEWGCFYWMKTLKAIELKVLCL